MNLVPPAGPKDAKIILVGEAPGNQEVLYQKPFAGSVGKKLEECLHSATIARSALYLTTVIKEKPPTSIKAIIDIEGKTLKISDRFGIYAQSLKDELSALDPNVIVAVGAVALYALTGETKIMKWHGSIMESTLVPGKKVIPILDPKSALSEHTLTYMIIHDLKRVKEESSCPELNLPMYNMILGPAYAQCCELLDDILTRKCPASYDIEVVGQEVECFAFATSPKDAFCIPLYDRGEVFTVEQEAVILQKVGQILEDPEIEIILQNGAFDCAFMLNKYGIMTTNIQDTMVAQGLITPDFPKGLDFICATFTRQPYYKDDGKQHYKGYSDDAMKFWRYNALDALVTYEAWLPLRADLEKMHMVETYNSTVAIIPALIKMQELGIPMDIEELAKESIVLEETIANLKISLCKASGMELNANSPKQIQNYFYVNKRIKPYTKQGRPTVDEKALLRIAAKGYPEARLILGIRKAQKLKSTYIEMDFDPDNRLRCNFNPVGTVTGRLSSSKNVITKKGGNMQNLPHSYYRFMLVDRDYVVYSSDLAGAENRIVAHCGPVPAMKRAFDEGKDVHKLTTSLVFGIPLDDPCMLENAPIGGGNQTYRQWGKLMNHSSNYGIGPPNLAIKLEISTAEAKKLLNSYHAQYPEVQSGYQRQIVAMLSSGRIITNPYGRRRLFLNRWGNQLFMDAYAHFAQSTVADIINSRGFPVLESFDEVDILNQIHDSLIFRIPVVAGWDYHKEVLTAFQTSIEQPLTWKNNSFTIPAETKMLVGNFSHAKVLDDFENLGAVYEELNSSRIKE